MFDNNESTSLVGCFPLFRIEIERRGDETKRRKLCIFVTVGGKLKGPSKRPPRASLVVVGMKKGIKGIENGSQVGSVHRKNKRQEEY
jgi:hypothetical protein